MKLVWDQDEMAQKSLKWLDFRKGKIGTSEISILLGTYPKIWCTEYELFLQKIGHAEKKFITNEHIERGNLHEDIARKYIENYFNNLSNKDSPHLKNVFDRTSHSGYTDVKFEQYTAQYKEHPQIFTSFDGVDISNKLVVEIKCPSQDVFTKLLKNRKPTIPKMYLPQVQMQLFIANSHWGIEKGLFGVFYKDGVYVENKKTKEFKLTRLILIETELDKDYCEELVLTCKRFCNMIDLKQWNNNWKN